MDDEKKGINVKPTADVILDMANDLERHAKKMRDIAENMVSKNDISYATEAIMEIRSAFGNLRLDLLVTRPIRELQKNK